MPVIPSIQSLVGTHSSGGLGVADWGRNRFFEVGSSFVSRYGLITGLEEAFVANANIGGTSQNIAPDQPGLLASGGIFVGASQGLNAGASVVLTPDFSGVTYIGWPGPNFPGGAHIGLTWSSVQYDFNTGNGNDVISVLNRVFETSATAFLAEQDNISVGCRACAGPAGAGTVYVMSPNSSGAGATVATLSVVQFNGLGFASNTIIGTVARTAVDPAWTSNFACTGLCLDQTDNKLIATFTGNGGGAPGRICKINQTTAAVEWTSALPTTSGGGPVIPGDAFSWSDIKHQRVGFYSGSPATVTIYNTSNGSVDSTYTSGIAGITLGVNAQAYSDTLGAVVLTCGFSQTTGSPTLLNSTPTSWGTNSWAVLYVAAGITPPPPTSPRRFLAVSGPIRRSKGPPTPPPTITDITTEAGLLLTTETGDNLITET